MGDMRLTRGVGGVDRRVRTYLEDLLHVAEGDLPLQHLLQLG